MRAPPRLTDRPTLLARRQRAATQGFADVLHRLAADEIEERLGLVNRTFTERATVSGFPVVWEQLRPGDRQISEGEVLPLEPGTLDLVVHALALHWADDPVGQLVQARRALRPDGLFLGVLFGGRTLAELRVALAEAEVAVMGGLSPRVAPMADLRDLGGLLQRAGFALPVADSVPVTLRYRDLWHLMRDLRAMGETNALAARHRRPAPRRLFEEAARRMGPAPEVTFELVVLTGWAPAESQPRPLRPGSATHRLAQALGTDEVTLPGPARD